MNNANPMPQPVKIIKEGEHSFSFVFFIPEDLIYFPGHFPAQSILPGVVVIDWCMQLAKDHLGLSPEFESMEVIKFKKLVMPKQTITLHLSYYPEKAKLHFLVDSDAGEHSSGKITLCTHRISGDC
jgi:3-hydroxymyristoyl/3-hydroxydecanoyl-(acyl carrier protein) dehydratase